LKRNRYGAIKHLSSWKNENSKYDVMPFMEVHVYVHTTVSILQKENKKILKFRKVRNVENI
jgi:hypothetical protein